MVGLATETRVTGYQRRVRVLQLPSDVRILERAVKRGLGERVLGIRFKVRDSVTGNRIRFRLFGKERIIWGFAGLSDVYSEIYEEEGRINARFYRSMGEAREGRNPYKIVAFSERKGDGKLTVLDAPQVLFVAPESYMQHRRYTTALFREFITGERKDGDTFDLEPHKVHGNCVTLVVNNTTKSDFNGVISVGGLAKCAGQNVAGRAAVEGDAIKVYFWPDQASRDRGEPAILPEGQVIARKSGDGKSWNIIWRSSSEEYRGKLKDTEKYGRYLFATVPEGKIHLGHWSTVACRNQTEEWRVAFKCVRRKRLFIRVPFEYEGSVLAETRQIGRRIKVINLFRNEEEYKEGIRPFKSRFITFRSNLDGWMHFWAGIHDAGKFEDLAGARHITRGELSQLFCDDGFERYNLEAEMRKLIDALELY